MIAFRVRLHAQPLRPYVPPTSDVRSFHYFNREVAVSERFEFQNASRAYKPKSMQSKRRRGTSQHELTVICPKRLCKECLPNACITSIQFAVSARVACIPTVIVAAALPTMPRKHSDVDYTVAMMQGIGRAAAETEEGTIRDKGGRVRVTCRHCRAS